MNLRTRPFIVICATAVACLLSGCSFFGFGGSEVPHPVRFSSIDTIGPEVSIVELPIAKRTIQNVLAKGDVINRARLIEPYSGPKGENELRKWRLFDVRKGSIYQLLGLENADIVLAAHDYVILSPDSFFGYLGLLPGFTESTILVERGGSRILFKYKITSPEVAK